MDSIVAIHDFAYDDYFLFYQLRWSKDLIKRALTNYAHSTETFVHSLSNVIAL